MKIGIDIRKIDDYGIGTHIKNVILYAAARDVENQYVLFSSPGMNALRPEPNFQILQDPSPKYSLQEQLSLARKASSQNLDLFHSPHFTLPFRLKGKAIVTIHDLIHLKFRNFFPSWKVKAAAFVIRRAIRKAEVVIAVSQTTREDILEYFPESKNKIEVVYNRLSPEWQRREETVDVASLGLPRDYLLYVGNFKKHKGLDTLIRAYQQLKDPPCLVLAGRSLGIEGDLSDMIFSNPNIRVLGYSEGSLLRALYSRSLLFIFPSLYEGFGYPPLEAMGCGTPVLSSDAPALKEILQDAAWYFERGNAEDLADKLRSLIQYSAKRTSLIEAGKSRAASFSTDTSPVQLLEIYRRFAPERASRGRS